MLIEETSVLSRKLMRVIYILLIFLNKMIFSFVCSKIPDRMSATVHLVNRNRYFSPGPTVIDDD